MYKSILFPVDLEHAATQTKALSTVKALASAFGAEVHVLTCVADVQTGVVAEFFPTDFKEKLVGDARTKIAAFVAENFNDAGKVDVHVAQGRPYKAIVAQADKLGCDLIVMASHKPEALDLLIGPNAENVVRHSKRSVLVVRD